MNSLLQSGAMRYGNLRIVGARGHPLICIGEGYRESIRDGREIYVNGERPEDVTARPMFKPPVDIRAGIYDMVHQASALQDRKQ